jgi:hypothetical protein
MNDSIACNRFEETPGEELFSGCAARADLQVKTGSTSITNTIEGRKRFMRRLLTFLLAQVRAPAAHLGNEWSQSNPVKYEFCLSKLIDGCWCEDLRCLPAGQ